MSFATNPSSNKTKRPQQSTKQSSLLHIECLNGDKSEYVFIYGFAAKSLLLLLRCITVLLLSDLLRFLTVFSRCLGHSRLPVQRILSVHWPGRQGELKNRTHRITLSFSLLTSQQAKGILMTYQTGYCESSQHYVNCPPKLLNTKAIYEADHLQGKQT